MPIEMLSEFNEYLNNLSKDYDLDIVYCDCEINETIQVKRGEKINFPKVLGQSGTLLQIGLDYLMNISKHRDTIIISDGYCDKLICGNMNEREMFEKSFERPKNYFELSEERQWQIDKSLGILDWSGEGLSKEDIERFKNHYKK